MGGVFSGVDIMSKRALIIIGAGGFAKEVAWTVERMNAQTPTYTLKGVCDDAFDRQQGTCCGVPLMGSIEKAAEQLALEGVQPWFHCTIGDNARRKEVVARALQAGWKPATIVDPSVLIAPGVVLGEGVYVGIGCVVSADVTIGAYALLNFQVTVGHDAVLGAYVQVCPGVRISGWCELGEGALLGSNAVIVQKRKMGAWSVLGAGTVAFRDILEKETMVRLG